LKNFELHINYDKLYANEFAETLTKLNEFYSFIDIILYETGESTRLIRVTSQPDNPNMEISHFERGSIKGFFPVKAVTIQIALSILVSSLGIVNNTAMLSQDIENQNPRVQTDIVAISQNETAKSLADEFIQSCKNNQNYVSVTCTYENKNGEKFTIALVNRN
jgi:NAD(P)H-flavin reductase